MKTISVLFLCFSLITPVGLLSQTCFPNGIVFNSQSSIDDFAANNPDCKIIGGNVVITGFIQNMNGLNGLEEIQGNLIIENASFVIMTGLNNLQKIGGNLEFKDNSGLSFINGFHSLDSIGGSFMFIGNFLFIRFEQGNFKSFNQLNKIGGSFILEGNLSLGDFTGLKNLKKIGSGEPSTFLIQGCEYLASLDGLESLDSVNGTFILEDNSILEDISGVETVSHFDGVEISNNPGLSSCAIQSICSHLDDGGTAQVENNEAGCNSQMEIEEACMTVNLSSPSFNVKPEVRIFPNPSAGQFTIEVPFATPCKVKILSTHGQPIKQFNAIDQQKIDLSNFPKGVYFLRVQQEAFLFDKKIMVL